MNIMRHQRLTMLFLIFVLCGACLLGSNSCDAKSKVKFKWKGSTLTISGKGKMPWRKNVCNNRKLKKVIIKKGITSIPDYAFEDCKKLTSVTIPNTVKTIGFEAFSGTAIRKITIPKSVHTIGEMAFLSCKKLKHITMPGNIKLKWFPDEDNTCQLDNHHYNSPGKTVHLSTPLKSLKVLQYINAVNWEVCKKDPKYKSIDGMIYSKNGKSLVRVPSLRKKVVIAEGCKEFCTQSIFYGFYWEDFEHACWDIKEIVFPKSFSSINTKKYACKPWDEEIFRYNTCKLSFKNKNVPMALLEELQKVLNLPCTVFAKALPSRFSTVRHMIIADTGKLIYYDGTYKKLTIPDNVTIIDANVFKDNKHLEEVTMSNHVTEIRESAFSGCKKLRKINLSNNLNVLGGGAFSDCSKLEQLVIPKSLQSMGHYTFSRTGIKHVTLEDGLPTIGLGMFAGCNNLTAVTIPASVQEIQAVAFPPATTLTFASGSIYNMATSLTIHSEEEVADANTGITNYNMPLKWSPITGVDGYELCVTNDENFTQDVTVHTVPASQTSLTFLWDNFLPRVRIRPFVIQNGAKIYGKWSTGYHVYENKF